ncbi:MULTISPECIES: EAL domain-containing protein [unclassified Cupriavidus]|uniref:putative bifunctional diguanylate cyclase/phosphodiesterase n=1 Tax=unclassified Cupriavidus TaxID=2640874 RepID=UPI001C001A26|nr:MULTISPECIES: EAL domain-containing protein [unclassified Cupriavidus]MCA3188439.1 EAL domain-containing protein [Cupriavidus sp.]MCA3188458.1 EAL domain-containing protein [Cupriavidus sp.]MCA3199448.1 EAL domain-containing protein [Cupriavidus sp.]MCA3204533.1 EAL domain-containing protein [Cupriavidus sp.]QWE97528.1 EAL domain-containing protein [Cupriavidus sp. EM10]
MTIKNKARGTARAGVRAADGASGGITGGAGAGIKPVAATQPWQTRHDQLLAVRRTVRLSIPINIILGVSVLAVAWHAGRGPTAAAWFAVSLLWNVLRIWMCQVPVGRAAGTTRPDDGRLARTVARHLRIHCTLALLSGLTWAAIPVLCDGYTSPQTLFYLTVVCGTTAGAVTHGFAYARIPLCFITPPLLSAAACLLWFGDFDKLWLAGTTVLYLAALIRCTLESERQIRHSIQLKNEATAIQDSLRIAHDHAVNRADEMWTLASLDPLTGLLSRSGFFDRASKRFANGVSGRHCLLLLDLDGFKLINDAFGHKAGDGVLREVARRLEAVASHGMLVGRMGGDEFMLLYDPFEHDECPATLAARLIEAVRQPLDGYEYSAVGISVGICLGPDISLDDMLLFADAALYAAKRAGRNSVYTFDDDLHRHLQMQRDVERDLPRALADDKLEVWFQPIFGEGGTRVRSLEALIRWKHARHGWVPPPELVSVAAASGLSETLLRATLSKVCRLSKAIEAQCGQRIPIAINLSPREMAQVAIDQLLLSTLQACKLEPGLLTVEITEEVALDVVAVQGKLANMAKAGVAIALDDFGVGYSGLGALRQLGAACVKVDRSFITDIARAPRNQDLMRAVLNLGRSFGFEVVAEGVEHEADRQTLIGIGCHAMQGYLLARPMPEAELLTWLQTRAAMA